MNQATMYAGSLVLIVLVSLLLRRGAAVLAEEDGAWQRLVERLSRPEDDPLATAIWARHRAVRLRTQLDRLTRLLAVDETMSATRQLGNRIAYRQLLADVAALPAVAEQERGLEMDRWTERDWVRQDRLRADRRTDQWAPVQCLPGRPDIEVLELGWR